MLQWPTLHTSFSAPRRISIRGAGGVESQGRCCWLGTRPQLRVGRSREAASLQSQAVPTMPVRDTFTCPPSMTTATASKPRGPDSAGVNSQCSERHRTCAQATFTSAAMRL